MPGPAYMLGPQNGGWHRTRPARLGDIHWRPYITAVWRSAKSSQRVRPDASTTHGGGH